MSKKKLSQIPLLSIGERLIIDKARKDYEILSRTLPDRYTLEAVRKYLKATDRMLNSGIDSQSADEMYNDNVAISEYLDKLDDPETAQERSELKDVATKQGKELKKRREYQFYRLIADIDKALRKDGEKVTATEIWRELCKNYEAYDEGVIITDISSGSVSWTSKYGYSRSIQKGSFNVAVTRARKKYPE